MNPTGRDVIAVFGASQAAPGDGTYEAGMECGRQLATAGYTVATGGYGGIMEAVCRGAADAGGLTIGVTAPTVFPERPGANKWVQHEIAADGLVERIGLLTSLAKGYMAMPGSLGTLAELLIAWNLAFVAPFANKPFGPVVTIGDPWRQIVPELAAQLATDGALVITVDTVEQGVAALLAALAEPTG